MTDEPEVTAIPATRRQALRERLLAKTRTEGRCWVWQGCRLPNGYGAIQVDGKKRSAHRVAYEAFIGSIPAELYVCHHCDNPACINPEHLFVGTAGDNARDRQRKGRGRKGVGRRKRVGPGRARGERVATSKLTEDQVRAIRASLLSGVAVNGLAKQYGVGWVSINRIKDGSGWRHVK